MTMQTAFFRLKKEDYLYFFMALFSLFTVWLIDAILPNDIIIVSLYVVPILVASYRFGSRIINMFAFASIVVYALQASMEHTSLINIGLHSTGLLIVSMLVLRLHRQKTKSEFLKNEVESAKGQLEVFMNIVAHDLMQPITAAKLYAGMLTKKTAGKNKELSRSLSSSLSAFEQLVVDLRDAARIGSGRFSLNLVNIDYPQLIRDMVAQEQMSAPRHTITFSAPARLTGKGDRERLRRVFANIVSNAVKYSPKGGKVKVVLRKEEGRALISVADQGVGMTEEEAGAIFQPFVRQYKGSSHIDGSGLGLYISKSIVDKHEGRIWCRSRKGKGSVFYVELPLARGATPGQKE